MDNYLDKARVNVAASNKNKMDLSSQHISTSDFMQLNVAKVYEMVPGSKLDVNIETFSRLNPLVVPTLGKAVIKTSKFFVPFRTIDRSFNDMIVDTIHIGSDGNVANNGIVDGVPTINNTLLYDVFMGASAMTDTDAAFVYAVDAADPAADIAIVTGYSGNNAQILKYNFTEPGRQAYKMLLSLGYNIVWDEDYDDTYSALPLLAMMRVYADWYFPMQYSNLSVYQRMLTYCQDDNGTFANISAADLRGFLRLMNYVQYESSVYTAAWDQPNSPSTGNYSGNYKFVNIDTMKGVIGIVNNNDALYTYDENGYITNNTTTGDGTNRASQANAPFIVPNVSLTRGNSKVAGSVPVSEYLLHSLHALTDFLKRHQLVGSRAYERLLARYGVSTPAEKLNRSVFLGSSTQAIQIGDIMATADTDGAELGKFAGKGISYGTSDLSFESDEFGYVLILSSIVPIVGYYQGLDPLVLRTRRTEFYIPEFDNLGVEPVLSKTLYTPAVATSAWTGSLQTQVYGFLPRYYSYKASCHDALTGNFRCSSLNGTSPLYPNMFNGAGAWHLMREFDQTDFPTPDTIVHSPDMMYGANDASQYKRLFYFQGSEKGTAPDNFTMVYNFDAAMYFPGKSLFDSYEFEDKGKAITTDVGGVKVN